MCSMRVEALSVRGADKGGIAVMITSAWLLTLEKPTVLRDVTSSLYILKGKQDGCHMRFVPSASSQPVLSDCFRHTVYVQRHHKFPTALPLMTFTSIAHNYSDATHLALFGGRLRQPAT